MTRQPILKIASGLTLALLAALVSLPARAQQAALTLSANPGIISADGRSTTTITATASGNGGSTIADGTSVHFSTTAGILSASVVETAGGVARVTLTSSPIPGTAAVTASYVGSGGGATGRLSVEFTTDAEIVNTDQGAEDWIRITSGDYLAYSADNKMIDAAAPKHGVKLTYRGLEIDADAMQAELDTGIVRARNAVIRRGHGSPLPVSQISYNLFGSQGSAMLADQPGVRTVQTVQISGAQLATTSMMHPAGSVFQFDDVSSSRVLITAVSVAARLNDRVQLKRANVFVDGKKLVSLPYQVMPLTTNQIFGQQVVGYGTSGFLLNVPYYASVSPHNTGAFYLRTAAGAQQNGTFYNGRAGMSLDYVNTYNNAANSSYGEFKLMGLSRGDWGMRWTHSQKFNDKLHGYFYIDNPNHKGLFTSANLTQQIKGASVSVADSITRNPSVNGYQSQSNAINTYVQTDPHLLMGGRTTGLRYTTGLSYNTGKNTEILPNKQTVTQTFATRAFNLNVFSLPVKFGTKSTLTDSMIFSQSQDSRTQRSALTVHGNLGWNQKLNSVSDVSFAYAYSHDPLSVGPALPAGIPNFFRQSVDKHDFSLVYGVTPTNNRWNLSLISTYSLPFSDRTLEGQFNYFPARDWHVTATPSYSLENEFAYHEWDFSVGRRVGSRELTLYWSTIEHRIRFDFGAAQF